MCRSARVFLPVIVSGQSRIFLILLDAGVFPRIHLPRIEVHRIEVHRIVLGQCPSPHSVKGLPSNVFTAFLYSVNVFPA